MDIDPKDILGFLPVIRNALIKSDTIFSHSAVVPHATYSPWLDDASFSAVYNMVRGNTLVDIYRGYELWSLVGQIACLDGDILEVGVWRGGTGCLMARRSQDLGGRAKVYLCDTFQGVVKAGLMDRHYDGGEHADTSVGVVADLAGRLGLTNIEILQGIFPEDTAEAISHRSFCLCHIDVDVYGSARDVMAWIWPRLVVGGVVVFDDYGFSTCEGITLLVNETLPKAGALVIHNLNGHAVFIKTAP